MSSARAFCGPRFSDEGPSIGQSPSRASARPKALVRRLRRPEARSRNNMAASGATMKNLAGLGKVTELRQRFLFLIFALFVYRVCSHIPVPGINPVALAEMFEQQTGTILDMFNMFSGGALGRFSVAAPGIMPYISASPIIQMLSFI